MKNAFLVILLASSFLTVSCATVSYHKEENLGKDGEVKVEFGNNQGVHVGDKVNVYENKCSVSGRGGNRCKFNLVGTLTLSKVESDFSYANPDGGLVLKEGYVFKLEKHCEKNPKECEQK